MPTSAAFPPGRFDNYAFPRSVRANWIVSAMTARFDRLYLDVSSDVCDVSIFIVPGLVA
jgi:hypothetical protein